MSDKIALVSCSGLSPLGLVVRAASVELALENENIVAACITEYSAQPNNCSPILDDAKIVTWLKEHNGTRKTYFSSITKSQPVRHGSTA